MIYAVIVGAVFIAAWVLAAVWFRSQKVASSTIIVGGGFIVACLVLIVVLWGMVLFVPDENPQAPEPPRAVVYNSGWDGSVRQVEEWMQNHLDDPASVERVEWAPVVETDKGFFQTRYKFRARNRFGATVLNDWVFLLGPDGSVLMYGDADEFYRTGKMQAAR